MSIDEAGLEDAESFEASLADGDAPAAEQPASSAGSDAARLRDPQSEQRGASATPGSSSPDEKPTTDRPLSHERWVGKRLSHFRIMHLIGAGKMGVVFQVEDVNLKRIAALKVLRRQVKGPEGARQVDRFLLEARAAAAIDHPCIAQVYEINEHQGWWYIAMEYLEGGSLHHLARATGPLSPGRAALMLADAARGLAAAHESGVIHRDIKPANLMLTRRGRCKLVDFGLVKLDSAENPFRDDQLVVGTPLYVAPEVAKGQGALCASDIYSLGATMYALLSGKPPFTGGNIRQVLLQHIRNEAPDVREAVPNCPEGIALLIRRAMTKDPAERPSADAFAATLQSELTAALASDSALAPLAAGSDMLAAPGSSTRTAAASASASGAGTVTPDTQPVSGRPSTRRWWMGGLAAMAVVTVGLVWWLSTSAGPGAAPIAAPSTSSQAGQTTSNSIGMKLAFAPAGYFVMGSPPNEQGRNNDERAVDVRLARGVYVSVTEVTQRQWAAVMGEDYIPPEGVHPNDARGRLFLGDTLPAYVSWFEAAEFCRRLSLHEGALYRLPTEAEWEHACRAGTTTAFHCGAMLNPAQANIDAETSESGGLRPHQRPLSVASYPANDWGLYDMHGNVMEWCADWVAEYALGPLTDPIGPPQGKLRVIRGGSWDSYARIARCANRWAYPPELRTDYIGFRVVLEPGAPPPLDQPSYLLERQALPSQAPALAESPQPVPTSALPLDPDIPGYTPEGVLEQRLRSIGSDTMDRLMLLWEHEFQQWHQQVVFRHEGKGSSTAVPALAEGLSHFGPMSRALKPAERRAFRSEYGYEPTQVVVAIDALAIYVHPDNPIAQRGLSLAELDAIFSSARKRGHPAVELWGDLDLGGTRAGAPIHVYGRNPASGTYGVFKEIVLLGGGYKPSNHELVGSAEVLEAVARDPLGIGYSGIGYNRPDVLTVPLAAEQDGTRVQPGPAAAYNGTYPLARELYLTVDLPPDAELPPLHREFLRFVYSREGQQLVIQAGFFPLNAEMVERELGRLGFSQ